MRNLNLVFCIGIMLSLGLVACQGGSNKVMDEARKSLPQSTTQAADPAATPAPAAGLTNSEPHYKCPNNCAGGVGEAAGTCATCGAVLAHNQAYHNQPGAASLPTEVTTPPAPTTPSPAQNAAGVYHYVCSNGCSGGAGSATACSSCGSMLAHNPAYHN